MTDGSKQKFMKAIFGEDGTSIDSGTAAALLAATCSGGDPEIADNIAQILLPELSDKVSHLEKVLSRVLSKQCDQFCQNFACLVKLYKSLAKFLHYFLFGKILSLL